MKIRIVIRYLRRLFIMLLVGPIRLYQQFISPLTPPTCKFHPTCSSYAVTSISRHGPLKGTALASYRLARCHPWQAGGLDPVPRRGAWKPDISPEGRTIIPTSDLRTHPSHTAPSA